MAQIDPSQRIPIGVGSRSAVQKPRLFLMIDTLRTGGSERQFAALAQALDPGTINIGLGCLRRTGAFLEGLGELAEFDVGGSFFTFRAHRARFALARHLRAQKVAIAHSFDFYSNLMMIPVARFAGVPIVIGSHRQLGDLLSPFQFYGQDMVFRLCDRVVCNSQAAAAQLVNRGLPNRKVVVIPNGLPPEAFADAEPALPRSPGVVRVGMIGRMNDPVKNYPAFLGAAAKLAAKFPMLEFLLVGDGPLRPKLEAMARGLGLGERAKFLGERHDIRAVLAATDISVVTSLSESLSNAILESMAAGVPVVATRVGGNPELIRDGETGLLVPPGNEDGLVEALERLLEQPSLRAEYGQRGRELASANFTLDQMRKRYEQLYRSLLMEKGRLPKGQHLGESPAADLSRPLKVVIVAPSLRGIGGQAVQASLLLNHWRNDPAVNARFIPTDPDLPRWLGWVERIPYLRTLVRMPFYLTKLWRGMQNVGIAHIFSASYWSFLVATVPAWLIARLRTKKVFVNYHSGEARDHLRRSRVARAILRRADQLIVPSRYLVDVFRDFGLRALVVPNTVDLDRFSFRLRDPLRPWLVCTRGFEPYYSVDQVVLAFSYVKKEFPEARLCLVGKGSLEHEIRAMVNQLKLIDVDFVGGVPHNEIYRFYDQADIFVNASWLDNMPLSILEAFASGTPVVSTAPEGIRYFVEHERTGLLSPPGDARALAENVVRVLRNPDLSIRLARNAIEESRHYAWDAVRDQWLEVYRTLMQPSPAAAKTEEARNSRTARVR